ncbi:hypothetical protein [Stenotrophomonas rhizophila]|uniref:hypothetical protein n=1 Tax=Stenotrophomonas rhizophila TaxID=216778 RepID=UPI001E48A8AD|nr:hypothetical protein [Stenotrophomonas rhizophila]MCC7633262.1 hypothetical protein [Stenotrophomonas rhizophila]MCC7662155.1 hypothetical protein [Stenotrophomonas rhizophila]
MAIAAMALCGLSGCVTLTGTYVVSATDAEGRDLSSNLRMTADGSRIYTARNALCSAHPGAVVHIKDLQTGEELRSESPYTCKAAK